MPSTEQIQHDLDRYCKAMIQPNGWQTCLAIERRYGLDGYPPQIVTTVLAAGARGEDMVAAEDRAIGADDA